MQPTWAHAGSFGDFTVIADQVRAQAGRLLDAAPETVVGRCHGDAWLGNALYDGGRAVLFDFEHQHLGPQSYDLACFLWWGTSGLGAAFEPVIRAFLETYWRNLPHRFSVDDMRFQILRRALNNLAYLGTEVTLSNDLVAEVALRAQKTIAWVAQRTEWERLLA